MEAKMEIKFNRKNESTVERFIYRYRLTGFLLKLVPVCPCLKHTGINLKQGDCRNDNPILLIQHMAIFIKPVKEIFSSIEASTKEYNPR
jgi:hypothetical protein